jgi:hypothetical protein
VGQQLAKANLSERAMDFWAADQLIELMVGATPRGKDKAREKLVEAAKKRLRDELNEVAADLAGPGPSPVERMLGEVAAMNWFALRLYEERHVKAISSDRPLTLAQSDHSQRRIDRTHRRLMVTLKALATVRRLALPAIQVNVARQRVNLAGPTLGGSGNPPVALLGPGGAGRH